ncbi:hypothetical protein P692DRAFT_201807027 [Suillus brevipes Sb2]|nr:hypothetical protein P692DRAFT_201807027 [Suillus brevipes Sb2]
MDKGAHADINSHHFGPANATAIRIPARQEVPGKPMIPGEEADAERGGHVNKDIKGKRRRDGVKWTRTDLCTQMQGPPRDVLQDFGRNFVGEKGRRCSGER